MRKFVRKYKRTEEAAVYDELFDTLGKAAGISEDEEELEKLKGFLEGDDEEAWTEFSVTFNALEENGKIEFMEKLNVINCFPPPKDGE